MKVFKKFNTSTKCPICGTNKEGKAILIPVSGTEEDGNVECKQVHLKCLDLSCREDDFGWVLIYQPFKERR